MGIKKRPNGSYEAWTYDPRKGRMVYVGSRRLLKDAKALFRDKTTEFAGQPQDTGGMSCDEYADRWLTVKHGPGTRREADNTLKVNRGLLKAFRETFGDRELRGGINRVEALDWARAHPTNAKAVSAMFNDAVDDMLADANPFGNRRLPEKRGRKDIAPLTEAEVARLAEIAHAVWHGYGRVVAAWITFLAWVGSRPSEAFAVTWEDVDLEAGRVTVQRVKGHKKTETIVLPGPAIEALLTLPAPRHGLLFRSVRGQPYDKGTWTFYWRPVRAAFEAWLAETDRDRLRELQAVPGALHPYALRHHAASIIVARGGNEYAVAWQLGNTPEVARDTYIHPFETEMAERVAQLLATAPVSDLAAARRRKMGDSA